MNIFLEPAILFFVFGIVAGLVKSNLVIPESISKFLSLYLFMSLGLKGGFALNRTEFTTEIIEIIFLGVILSIIIPISTYFILKNFISKFDAAAVAATYGSVSAVTFVTATQYLTSYSIEYNGIMAAVMAIMEIPAIILAILFSNWARKQNTYNLKNVFHESLTHGTSLLLIGALIIGFLSGDFGQNSMQTFAFDLFKGLLAFFLLDMGLQVAKNMPSLKNNNIILLGYGITFPIMYASLTLIISGIMNISLGNTVLLMILASSASYIAVPAVIKNSIPEANPGIYIGLSLGLTFPFNILIGIPLYTEIARRFL
ncbi:MAG: sodium-dependent bicarbonate transport family permease [Minisyncoccia bacterium]